MLPIPTPASDPRNLADWLEFAALAAKDGNSSATQLRQVLVASGSDEALTTARRPEQAAEDETLTIDAFAELDDRATATRDAYPFDVDGGMLRLKAKAEDFWPYIFCLLLSLKGADRDDAGPRPTAFFEELAEIAARNYLSGKSAKFGFPRRVLPANFIDALNEICRDLGEGRGCKKRPEAAQAKDARLDIVAWRGFPDKRPAQMVLFGQCATGASWQGKLTELQPDTFMSLFLNEALHVMPVRGFFTPFRLGMDRWEMQARQGGILFDRCRIAFLARGAAVVPGLGDWCRKTFEELRE